LAGGCPAELQPGETRTPFRVSGNIHHPFAANVKIWRVQ
jgi:hypothetical protein